MIQFVMPFVHWPFSSRILEESYALMLKADTFKHACIPISDLTSLLHMLLSTDLYKNGENHHSNHFLCSLVGWRTQEVDKADISISNLRMSKVSLESWKMHGDKIGERQRQNSVYKLQNKSSLVTTSGPKKCLNPAPVILTTQVGSQRLSRRKELQVHLLQFSHFTDEKTHFNRYHYHVHLSLMRLFPHS